MQIRIQQFKRGVLLLCIGAATLQMFSQDIIIKRNGEEICTKITKVNSEEIEYKRWTYLNGPVYTIQKRDIFMIKYANKEKEIFASDNKQQETQKQNNATTQYIKENPADNNQLLIDTYKSPVHFAKTPEERDARYFFPIMAMSDTSLISTSSIEMKILPTIELSSYNDFSNYDIQYAIEIRNKTEQIIYIDLANTFRISQDGTSISYFDSKQTTTSHGSNSGAGVNIGGITGVLGIRGVLGTLANSITVGGSNQYSTSTTYTSQRILAIPPHSKKEISDNERFWFYNSELRGILKKNGYISYSEDNSPYNVRYIITYSASEDFTKYSYLYTKLYTRYIYGGDWSNYLVKPIKQIQKSIPNFWENKGIIVGESCEIQKEKKRHNSLE